MLLIGTNPLAADNTCITDFDTGDIGSGGWFLEDTRNADSNDLIGGSSYLNLGITHSLGQCPGNIYGSDAISQIRSQIQWNNYYDTRGNLGGLYLGEIESASGQSTISTLYSDKGAGSFGDASLMSGEDFSVAYCWQKLEDLTSEPTVAGVSLSSDVHSTLWGNWRP